MTAACAWCGGPVEPRKDGGRPKRFCQPVHRRLWDTEARRVIARMVAEGQLMVGPVATRALVTVAKPGNTAVAGRKSGVARPNGLVGVRWAGAV
jgi:hypothetical protein